MEPEQQNEIQTLRLALRERDQTIGQLKHALERERNDVSEQVSESVQTSMERLFDEAAVPIIQILMQDYFLQEGKAVKSHDVIRLAKRLIKTLEENGLTIEGTIGETVFFDSNYHKPLSMNLSPTTGESVMVRLVGVSYQGKILCKIGVNNPTLEMGR
ncbi:MAG: hypothetical protein B6242_01440 [Anaerolineaceae bacterium 4572_78]|nr:MAG: hypothetical protein B6242_01440 [Anaerolineaceae bacterium 4572_78]